MAASADAEQSRLLGLVSAQAAALADKERQLEVSATRVFMPVLLWHWHPARTSLAQGRIQPCSCIVATLPLHHWHKDLHNPAEIMATVPIDLADICVLIRLSAMYNASANRPGGAHKSTLCSAV